jgi:2-polyprenyl-6-methoxyphenol hydroxylase-like FAD-dependent oxidoreductase
VIERTPEHLPVLVVGGGLSGLSTAVFLARHGTVPVLVERRPDTSIQPRARGQFPTTMEALGVAGVAGQVRDAAPPGADLRIVIAESLTGRVLHDLAPGGAPDFRRFSPAGWGHASQERVEAILAARARELGARLRFATQLESFTQDADGVSAVLRDLRGNVRYPVRAQYLVGADGVHGTVRDTLGVGTHGPGAVGHVVAMTFEADLTAALGGRAFALFHLRNPALAGRAATFVTTDDPGRYSLNVGYAPERGESLADFTPGRCAELIRLAAGLPDLAVRVLETARWQVAARVADRFSAGRVHLVGDAAHVAPPTGGSGGNTAILDGHALAWKLAAVLAGTAGPGLLDSHDPERRPVAEMLVAQQHAAMADRAAPAQTAARAATVAAVDPATAIFGYRYPTGAVRAEPGEDGAPLEDPAAPTGRPGSRAPHIPLARRGQSGRVRPISTIDLYGRQFVLLGGPDGADWARAATQASRALGVALDSHTITDTISGDAISGDAISDDTVADDVVTGSDAVSGRAELADPDGRFIDVHRIGPAGAVLVRPDGFIAWRTREAADPAALTDALRGILGREAATVPDHHERWRDVHEPTR